MVLARVFAIFTNHLPEADREGRWRIRLLVEGLGGGMAVATVLAASFFLVGAWRHALVCLLVALTLSAALGLLYVTRRQREVAHLAMAATTLIFLLPVTEVTLDGSALAFLAVVPYMGTLLVERREALGWMVLTVLLTALALGARAAGLVPILPGFGGPTISAVRLVGLIVTVYLFGTRFAQERRAAIHELESVNRAKSAFLANMSHEIRTPMNGVLGLTEALLLGPLPPAHREQLELIQRSGQTLVSLINDLLDMSKIEAKALTLERTDFSLPALVRDLEQLGELQARQKGLALHVHADPALPAFVRGDALRVRQVLTNLLNNALKFTLKGEVRLEVRLASAAPTRVAFAVRDTGIGIAPEVLPALFRPFQQADRSTTRRFGGSGLGLALSKELVKQMGSELGVESTLGVGSAFHFELPFEAGSGALSTVAEPVATARTARPVLVVDDNPINLKVAVSLVERAGYRTRTAVNGAEAIALVQQEPFLVVLMDCHMPVMDGFEATEKIRGLDGDVALLPIIALTASVMPDELERCKLAGMNECLTKPVSLRMLAAALAKAEAWAALQAAQAPS